MTGVAGRSTAVSGVCFLLGGAAEGARWSAMSSAFRLREAVEGGVVMFWESRSRRDDEISRCEREVEGRTAVLRPRRCRQ